LYCEGGDSVPVTKQQHRYQKEIGDNGIDIVKIFTDSIYQKLRERAR